jgi:hypothetical protein
MVMTALLIAASLFLAFFHFHADGSDHADCPVCRLVQFISGIFVLLFSALLLAPSQGPKFQPVLETRFSTLLLPSSLKDRAPPFFSF